MSDEVRVDRLIAAPVERVFAAFTESGGQLALYERDEPGWVVRSECDLRVGGTWVVDFGPSASELYRHHQVFTAIEPPHRIAVTTTETRLDGSSLTFEVEFTFAADDGGTRMTMTQRGFPTRELRDEHGRGMPHALASFAMTVED